MSAVPGNVKIYLRRNRYNSAAGCSISLRFGTEVDNVAADILQIFKIKGSKVEATAWRDVPELETFISQESIGLLSSNLL